MEILHKSYVLIILIFLGISCGESSQTAETAETTQPESTESEPEEIILYSVINELNVRDEAGREGKVLTKLKYGQRALYLNEETDYKEKIIMRGISRTDSWKKIRCSSGAGGAAIEGWVYGGGMLTEQEVFQKTEEGSYVRKLENITREELSKIIGMTLAPDFVFNGEVKYKKSKSSYLKHGEFQVTALPKSRENEWAEVSVVYKGEYADGKANGTFLKTFYGYESQQEVKIMFENGKCQWSEIKGEGEGESWENRIENPEKCTFSFTEKALIQAE